MAQGGEEPDGSKRTLERARRSVLGHLAPAILHETNNVLTVMAGVRQIMKSGAPVSERIGTMIDEQLARMERLVGSIRRIGPDDLTGPGGGRALTDVAEMLEAIVALAGKGRGVAFERGEVEAGACVRDGEALSLAALCLALPLFPPRGQGGGARLRFCGRSTADGVAVELEFGPLRQAPEAEDAALAQQLVAAASGSFRVESDAARLKATLALPAALPRVP